MDSQNVGFLQDDKGSNSSMRLMCMISLFGSLLFGLLTILLQSEGQNVSGIYITMGFLVSAFAPKSLQKYIEEKIK